MLHLLRLIRKDLIQVNNVKKYSFYAIGEILLIVIGILIAVQIGNWNERRIERVEEREVLARISDEVTRHAEIISLIRSSALPDAQKALEYVTSVFNGAPIAEDSDFLNAVVRSGAFGYSTPRLPITTYEELVNSGKLQLIETVDLRERISAYYLKNDDTERRGDAVKGDYGLLTFDLVPRGSGGNINTTIDSMSEEMAEEVVASVLQSDLRRYIIPQRNRLEFLEYMYVGQLEAATELLAEIEKELEGK